MTSSLSIAITLRVKDHHAERDDCTTVTLVLLLAALIPSF